MTGTRRGETNEAKGLLGLLKKLGGRKNCFLPFHIDYLSDTGSSSKSFQSNSLYITWIITKPKAESNYRVRDVKASSKEM